METMAGSINRIRERVQKACIRAGRNEAEIRIMAVSKFQSAEKIAGALENGITLFGENRVQEALEKFPLLKQDHPGIELHLIGTLQRNKAKAALGLFDAVQSVDREALVAELGKLSAGRARPLPVLLEVHTAEDTKSGFRDIAGLQKAAEMVLSYPSLKLAGLMTMAPDTDNEKRIRTSFRRLLSARSFLAVRFPREDLSCLSMGMSNDFEIAIEEGSTLLRIGRSIFGER